MLKKIMLGLTVIAFAGAGVAIADLSGIGKSDLVVLMVDNPTGQNRGVYRVGRNLDAAGNPTGGGSCAN